MKPRPVAGNRLPTLIVDPNAAAAAELAAQLTRAGFPSKVAVTCVAALDAVATQYFRSVIVVAALDDPECLRCLRALSRSTPQSWLIVISSDDDGPALDLVHRCGGDALLTAPFAVRELVSRLAALSMRARPV
jgi:DNA-binding response OmpR family regulator